MFGEAKGEAKNSPKTYPAGPYRGVPFAKPVPGDPHDPFQFSLSKAAKNKGNKKKSRTTLSHTHTHTSSTPPDQIESHRKRPSSPKSDRGRFETKKKREREQSVNTRGVQGSALWGGRKRGSGTRERKRPKIRTPTTIRRPFYQSAS